MWDDTYKVDISPTQSSPASAAPSTSRPRVALFCSEALRPVVCCVIDALEVRGYRVHLRTGRNAGGALQRSRRRRDADLRVVFIAAGLEPGVREKLQLGLDPHQRGDVMVLPFDRPRDAIEAIEIATGRIPPRRVRPPRPTRAALTHATLVESKVDMRRWVRPAFTGLATIAALAAVVIASSPAPRSAEPIAQSPATPVTAKPKVLPRSEGITLAATRPAPAAATWDDESYDEPYQDSYQQAIEDEEIIIIEDEEPAAPVDVVAVPNKAPASTVSGDSDVSAPSAAAPHTSTDAPTTAGISRPTGSISLADPFSM